MSNSIWKKPGFHEAIDDKLKVSKDGKWVYWTMYGWNIPGEDVHDIGVEWAYLEDVLAQADKAERWNIWDTNLHQNPQRKML